MLVLAFQFANQPPTMAPALHLPAPVAASSLELLINSFPETPLSEHNLQSKGNFLSSSAGENGSISPPLFSQPDIVTVATEYISGT